MSTDYLNANEDLDWVQAPPQAFTHDRKNRRKNSNHQANANYRKKKFSNGDQYQNQRNYYAKSRYNKGPSKYSKKSKPSYYLKNGHGPTHKNSNPKKNTYQQYIDSKNFKVCYNQFDELSTDVSDNTSPDRQTLKECNNMKVEVLGEVVVNRINPKFSRKRRRNYRFAAACELKAPEPNEIAPPMFL